jgi:2,4-dienoyl-CoA reductase-like NADH-dependent reductase (Old Yellow Enzyme family)
VFLSIRSVLFFNVSKNMTGSALLFSSFALASPQGPCILPNRIVVAPMCQYQAHEGSATDWHLAHWTQMLNSGAGLFTIEATAVVPEGRITPGCLGLWDDHTESALTRALQRARALAPHTAVCIQLAHAGRKASSAVPWQGGQLLNTSQGGWPTVAPSAIPHLVTETAPHSLTIGEIIEVRRAFVKAAQRAQRANVDAIELHSAHGYLLHQFLSPLANQRTDLYGGSFQNRIRLLLEIFSDVRACYSGVFGVRISASDWVDGGWDAEESVELSKQLHALGCNFIHVSSGGISPLQKIAAVPGYQLGFARQIKQATGLATTAVGLITEPHQAEQILQNGDADLIALGRAFLYQPRWGWYAAVALHATVQAHPAYWRCLPATAEGTFGNVRQGGR